MKILPVKEQKRGCQKKAWENHSEFISEAQHTEYLTYKNPELNSG